MIDQICINEALLDGAKEVFETMVFMDIIEATEPDQIIDGWALLSSITFKGDLEGCLAICCDINCAKAIAINMLALDLAVDLKEVGEEETCDAMGEIANMVMGSLKARLHNEVGKMEVSIPSVVSGRALQNNLGEGSVKILIRVNIQDEYIAELSLLYRDSRK
jgi:chemotaxis protein CheX